MTTKLPAVSLERVAVSFPLQRSFRSPRYWALKDVTLEVQRGAKLGVLGRNGAGKSTLLRLLSGALSPDRGSIVRNHGPVQLLTLGIGFLPHLSGRDNAILSGLLQGFSRKEIELRLEAIRDFSELDAFFDRPINTYSSGMVSRLGFAVAMQLDPDVLLIDEVLSVGDAAFRRKSHSALRKRFESDHTVVLVSHNESTLSELCTSLAWIEGGKTIAVGPTKDVLKEYGVASRRTRHREPRR